MATSTPVHKKPIEFSNLLLGAGLNLFEVSTLGQPLEVIKTTVAAHRGENMLGAVRRIWGRGGILGFWQGLIPWAWLEASTKGGILLFTSNEVEYIVKSKFNASNLTSGILCGVFGGIAQAYLSVGFCTCMKTIEITRTKQATAGVKPASTWTVFADIYRREGIRGLNKGVNAVAVRQCTNWGSRFGFSRLAEDSIRSLLGYDEHHKLSGSEKVIASAIGGGLSTWNQPIEVARVELQSQVKDPNRPQKMNTTSVLKYIYQQNGIRGLYRGVTPRIGLSCWQTICMVGLGDIAKDLVVKVTGKRPGGH